MASLKDKKSMNTNIELATFYVGDALYGMDILRVQEINRLMDFTKVPQAPEYVMGIMNLRGQIVTVIDLSNRLGLPTSELKDENRNIIVNDQGEYIGLLVDRISDVVRTDIDRIEPPPSNMGGVQGKFLQGVFKTENNLVGILNIEELLKTADEVNPDAA